jgi:predicted kinase
LSERHRYNVINNNGSLFYAPYEYPINPICYVLSGLPGAGKDFYISKNYKKLEIISLDEIRNELGLKKHKDKKIQGQVIQLAFKRVKAQLNTRNSFVWNSTNITKRMRSTIISLCETYEYDVKIIYIEVPYKNLLRQNSKREFAIPTKALEKLIDKLEPPTINECHQIEFINH